MQSLLDIFNTIVTHHLDENVNFVYALLMEKDIFTQFRTHPQMNTLIENLDKVSQIVFSISDRSILRFSHILVIPFLYGTSLFMIFSFI